MRQRYQVLGLILATAVLLTCAPLVAQETSPPVGVPMHMVVTVEARHGSKVPDIGREDVMVYQGHDRRKTIDWVPLQGDRAGLELFVLVDDAADSSLGSQLKDISGFITAQPAATKIGVAYMQNGAAHILQNPTPDHTLASKALRLPLGELASGTSPYFAIADLVKRWPDTTERREVLVISDGIDRYWGSGAGDPYVDSAIEDAQRAGIVIFAIYSPGEGHYGHSSWRVNWGQNYLSQLADETGGEAYYLGNGAPVSFTPYLDDLTHRLTRQYELTFLAMAKKKAGMQQVKLETEVPNADLVSADKVFVPAIPE
jgi:hypothetical protein